MSEASGRLVEILVVDDNVSDARLVREALKEAEVPTHVSTVQDGADALSFLRHEGIYGKAPRPHLILLDLNMPKKSGHAVLAEIKADPALKRIPVIILTTSQAEEDIARSYDLHANSYITKPMGLDQYVAAVKSIESYWLAVAQLPPQ